MTPNEEREHLLHGVRANQSPGGVGLIELIAATTDTSALLARARAVLTVVLDSDRSDWLDDAHWQRMLPAWFKTACAPDLSEKQATEELARWRALPAEDRQSWQQDKQWSTTNWLYWMHPDNRTWFWWDARAENDRVVRLQVQIDGWPTPTGSLRWLLRAAGATNVEQAV